MYKKSIDINEHSKKKNNFKNRTNILERNEKKND